jgi:hypothetical protein
MRNNWKFWQVSTISISTKQFPKCSWRCKNILAFLEYNFLFRQILYKNSYNTPWMTLGGYKNNQKNFQKMIELFFLVEWISYLQGKLWFIWCWLMEQTIWGILFCRQPPHLVQKNNIWCFYKLAFHNFQKNKVDIV